MPLQETALLGIGQESSTSLPSGVTQLKRESPGLGAQLEEQGKESPVGEGGKTGWHGALGLFGSLFWPRSYQVVLSSSLRLCPSSFSKPDFGPGCLQFSDGSGENVYVCTLMKEETTEQVWQNVKSW